MARNEAVCPTCDGDIPLAGDEVLGEELYCTFCGAPCKVRRKVEQEIELEADY